VYAEYRAGFECGVDAYYACANELLRDGARDVPIIYVPHPETLRKDEDALRSCRDFLRRVRRRCGGLEGGERRKCVERVYAEFRDRLSLDDGNVDALVCRCRQLVPDEFATLRTRLRIAASSIGHSLSHMLDVVSCPLFYFEGGLCAAGHFLARLLWVLFILPVLPLAVWNVFAGAWLGHVFFGGKLPSALGVNAITIAPYGQLLSLADSLGPPMSHLAYVAATYINLLDYLLWLTALFIAFAISWFFGTWIALAAYLAYLHWYLAPAMGYSYLDVIVEAQGAMHAQMTFALGFVAGLAWIALGWGSLFGRKSMLLFMVGMAAAAIVTFELQIAPMGSGADKAVSAAYLGSLAALATLAATGATHKALKKLRTRKH